MADRLGRKRTLVIGLSVFLVASLLCSLAPTVELLVAFRVLQGIGASMLNPGAMTALGAVVLVLGLLATGGRATKSAQKTAVEFNPEALGA
jgi:MFS family permease